MTLAPWHEEAWRLLDSRRRAGTFPHALLLSGASGFGKREFAEQLAAALLCEDGAAAPCGVCRSCRLYANRSQRDPVEMRPDDRLAQPHGHPGHPDARFVGHVLNEKASPKKMYTEIVVEQVRDLSEWLALPAQFGKAQVALIDPADQMNVAAANALLKTLEEPGERRHLILVSSYPARLPATIRSRCQRVTFAAPTSEQALEWLGGQRIEPKAARSALQASGGNPGLALRWLRDGGLDVRAEVLTDLRALCAEKTSPVEVANRWGRADAQQRLWFAAALLRDEAEAQARGAAGPLALTPRPDFTKLSKWFDQTNRARELLRGPLRSELVVLEALAGMAPGAKAAR